MYPFFLFLILGILVSSTRAESNETTPTVVGPESGRPSSSNNSTGNSTTALVETSLLASASQFYEFVGNTCEEHISALQTCPKSKAQRDAWLDISMRVARCIKLIYNTRCNSSDAQTVTKKYPTYNTWVRDRLNMTGMTVEKKEGCDYPDFLPILHAATDKSRRILNPKNHTSFDDSSTICGSMAGEVIITAPVQYVRCVRQNRSPNDITACVLSTVDAVAWISLDFFLYNGQDKKCKTGDGNLGTILVPMIFSFLFELARFAVDLWLWKRECARKPDKPPRYFSWINLCERIISGFGIPILTAYIVFPHSFEASVLAILSIFVLKPQAAPIIAIPAKKMIGTGYGAQLLFVDSLIALSGIFIVLFAGFNVVPNFNFTGPEAQKLMSLGLYITVLPMLVIYGIYNISQVFFVFFMALGLLIYWCTRYSRILKWALSVLLFWWGLIICFALSPIFAIVELGWNAYRSRKKLKGEDKVFPLAKFFAAFFDSDSGHWLMKIGKRLLYYPWTVLMFAVFVGRWMALVNLFAIAGDAFCPASWASTVVAYVFLSLATIVIPTTLHFFGLSF